MQLAAENHQENMSPVHRRQLEGIAMFTMRNGMTMPEIGFGTYLLTDALTGGRAEEIIADAITAGYRHLDTAAFYENEDLVGRAVRSSGVPRSELTVATKVWRTELGYDKTAASIDASLRRLDLGYIDLFLIHWPTEFPGDPDWKQKLQGSWRAMEAALQDGRIRSLGLSNFMPHHIMAILETATETPVLNQLELHVGHMQYAAVDYCRRNDILVQAWRPRGQKQLADTPILQTMADRYGVSVTALMLQFLLQQGIAVIPRSSSPAHLRSNLRLPAFRLTDADLEFLKCMPPMGWSGQHPDFDRVVPAQ